jgi:hypothetical protein
MNNKIWLFVVIGLLLMIGIGGKVFIDNQKDKETQRNQQNAAEKIETEKMSVEALKNTFADLKSVEFEKSVFNEITGVYAMFVKMTNQKNESVSFSFNYRKESRETDGYTVENEEVQVEGVTTNKVHVIYSNKDEGEV